jgi:hypothetical protein
VWQGKCVSWYERTEVVNQAHRVVVCENRASRGNDDAIPFSEFPWICNIPRIVVALVPLCIVLGISAVLIGLVELVLALLKSAVTLELSDVVLLDHDNILGGLTSCPPSRLNIADEMLQRVKPDDEIACREIEAFFGHRRCNYWQRRQVRPS